MHMFTRCSGIGAANGTHVQVVQAVQAVQAAQSYQSASMPAPPVLWLCCGGLHDDAGNDDCRHAVHNWEDPAAPPARERGRRPFDTAA